MHMTLDSEVAVARKSDNNIAMDNDNGDRESEEASRAR